MVPFSVWNSVFWWFSNALSHFSTLTKGKKIHIKGTREKVGWCHFNIAFRWCFSWWCCLCHRPVYYGFMWVTFCRRMLGERIVCHSPHSTTVIDLIIQIYFTTTAATSTHLRNLYTLLQNTTANLYSIQYLNQVIIDLSWLTLEFIFETFYVPILII